MPDSLADRVEAGDNVNNAYNFLEVAGDRGAEGADDIADRLHAIRNEIDALREPQPEQGER